LTGNNDIRLLILIIERSHLYHSLHYHDGYLKCGCWSVRLRYSAVTNVLPVTKGLVTVGTNS